MHAAQVSRKLTFLYLANDVIQNSKKKGPEFTQDFAPIIVDAFKHVYRSDSTLLHQQYVLCLLFHVSVTGVFVFLSGFFWSFTCEIVMENVVFKNEHFKKWGGQTSAVNVPEFLKGSNVIEIIRSGCDAFAAMTQRMICAAYWQWKARLSKAVNGLCVFLCREGEEGCKKQLGRVLSIWQERAVYENNLLDQLSQVLCKFICR